MIREVGRELGENHLIEIKEIRDLWKRKVLVTCVIEVRNGQEWKVAVGFGS